MFTFYYRAKNFCVQDGATIENRLRDPIMQSEFMNWKCMGVWIGLGRKILT